MRVIQINGPFNVLERVNQKYSVFLEGSRLNLLDADFVLVEPKNYSHSYMSYYEPPLLPYDDSDEIRKHNIDEIKQYLNSKKSIVVFLSGDFSIFVEDQHGLGLNSLHQKDTTQRQELLPHFKSIINKKLNGINIDCIYEEFTSLYLQLKELGVTFEYKYVLNKNQVDLPLIKIKGTNKIVGGVKFINGGKIIYLPELKIALDRFSPEEEHQIISIVTETLYEFTNSLSHQDNDLYEMPEWLTAYSILDEEKIVDEKIELERQLANLSSKIEDKEKVLITYRDYKSILSSSGTHLEVMIAKIFQEIGYTVKVPNQNRVDLIISNNDQFIVCEVKGVTKSAGEKFAAQLEKWSSYFYDENGIEAKGLLIVCGYMNKQVQERQKEITFPPQMLDYVMRKDQCCISTETLLSLFIKFKRNEIGKNDIWEMMISTKGELVE